MPGVFDDFTGHEREIAQTATSLIRLLAVRDAPAAVQLLTNVNTEDVAELIMALAAIGAAILSVTDQLAEQLGTAPRGHDFLADIALNLRGA
jgi:hypothetical protein